MAARGRVQKAKDAAADERREAMLKAAKLEFLEHGYDATSMDAVAARAGTTKRTLYAYFASKEALYQCLVDYGASLFREALPPLDAARGDIAGQLTRFCVAVLANIAWEDAVRMQQMVLGTRSRFPDLPKHLYAVSIEEAAARLTAFLKAAVKAGHVPAATRPKEAGRALLAIATGPVHLEVMMGVRDPLPGPLGPVTEKAIDRAAVRRAVECFLAGLG